jgi:type IV pilus assembly protein PilQ
MRPARLTARLLPAIFVAGVSSLVLATGATPVRLVGVSATTGATNHAVFIDVSEPVAYSVSRPDPLTVLLELRNVQVEGAESDVIGSRLVRHVEFEDGVALDGNPVGRVRLLLSRPAAPHVESERTRIRVELSLDAGESAERAEHAGTPDAEAPPADAPRRKTSSTPPQTATRDLREQSPSKVGPGVMRDADTGESIPVFSDLTHAAGTGSIDPMSALRLASATVPAPGGPSPAARQEAPPAQTPPPPPAAAPAPSAPPSKPNAASLSGLVSPDPQKQYTGHPVSLDFQNADLRSVLRTFAEISGLNMVIDPGVQGTVDIVLTDVPWDQALDTILRANNLGYTVDGTIVRIAQLTTLQAEQEQRKKLQQAQAEAGQTMVRTFTLSYARATDVQPLLTRSALSSRGQIQVDVRTNTLILTDLPERLETAANLISILDRPEPQVEVEARVVQTTRDFAHAIGVQWGFGGRLSPELGNTLPFAFPNRAIVGGRGAEQGPEDSRALPSDKVPSVFSAPVTGEGAATVGVQLGAVNGAFNLDVALSALERSGKGRVLSTPRLTTQNNVSAEVAQGIQIPIQTVANNTVTVSFKDAVLLLKVTPQITSANTVIMQITIENASPDFSRSVNNIPPIDTQRAITQVQVNDGATTVIGGIFVSREQSSNNRVPLLHRIPLLGWLFKRDSVSDESRELLIFITPRIMRG